MVFAASLEVIRSAILQASFGRKMRALWPTQPSKFCTSGVVQHLLSSEQVDFEMKAKVMTRSVGPWLSSKQTCGWKIAGSCTSASRLRAEL